MATTTLPTGRSSYNEPTLISILYGSPAGTPNRQQLNSSMESIYAPYTSCRRRQQRWLRRSRGGRPLLSRPKHVFVRSRACVPVSRFSRWPCHDASLDLRKRPQRRGVGLQRRRRGRRQRRRLGRHPDQCTGLRLRHCCYVFGFLGDPRGMAVAPSWVSWQPVGGWSRFGRVGRIGDVNGDGFDDVTVGREPLSQPAGRWPSTARPPACARRAC